MNSIFRSKTSLLGTTALLAVLSFSLVAAAKLGKTGTSTAGFRAMGPAGLKIEGKTSELSVADDGTTVTITVPLTSLDTGVGLRDKHTRNYLEVQTYPSAELKVARSSLKFPAEGAESVGDAKGTLKIHGQAKDVTFHYVAKRNGGALAVQGSTRININEFGIKTPSYLGVSVKPDVDVYTNFQATDN